MRRAMSVVDPVKGLVTVAVMAVALLWAGVASAEDSAAKLGHYCKYWGSAGLFPDDQAKVEANPLATLSFATSTGQVEVPLIYIWKGYELDESPKEWAEIWRAFGKVCSGWAKPDWLVKLEAWQAANKPGASKVVIPKEDPRARKTRAEIEELLEKANRKEAQAQELRAAIEQSPKYRLVTGGSDNWRAEAELKATKLSHVVDLGSVTYTVIGRVLSDDKKGNVEITGVAIAPKNTEALGTRIEPTKMKIQGADDSMVRSNGHFFAERLYLTDTVVPTASPAFATKVDRALKKRIAKARGELRKVKAILRNGEKKLARLMRPVDKLQGEARQLRDKAKKLEGRLTASK